MEIKPLGERVVVKPMAEHEITKSGIVLPSTVEKERSEQGEVVAVGPGKMLENGSRAAMNIAVGNKVVFKKYAAHELKIDGEDYLILDESDVLAILA